MQRDGKINRWPALYPLWWQRINLIIDYLNQKIMKDLTELKGNWNQTKEKLKQKFVILTEGEQDEMLGKLQVKLDKKK
jgi:hypothetical protein